MTALELVTDLERQGVKFWWNGSKVRVGGRKDRLTCDYLEALATNKKKVEVIAQWRTLQEAALRKFGKGTAALYPFRDALVQTPHGPARISAIHQEFVYVSFDGDSKSAGQRQTAVKLELKHIHPPLYPPSSDDFSFWLSATA